MCEQCSEVCELTEEAGLAEVHIHALQTSVAVPRRHPLTAITGDDNIEQVAIACNEHVHLWTGPGKYFTLLCKVDLHTAPIPIIYISHTNSIKVRRFLEWVILWPFWIMWC